MGSYARVIIRWLGAALVAVVAASVTAAPAGASSTWYVSPSGSDAAAGTESAPWRTVAHAVEQLEPGDTLLVRGGTYRERVRNPVIRRGSASSPITVRAHPGERPVIQGLLWLSQPSYWVFDGINVTWDEATGQPTEHMVKITNGVGWTYRNSEIWGARSFAGMLVAGTTTGEPSQWSVVDNCIHDTYPTNGTHKDHNLYINSGTTAGPGLVEGNLFFNALNGENVKMAGPSSTSGGAVNVRVSYNTMWNAAQNVLIGWQSSDNLVTRNILGKTKTNYGNVRGYQLSGTNNVAADNIGFDAKTFILNYDGGSGVSDGGSNLFPLDPLFNDTTSCAGFHPTDARATGHGHHALVRTEGGGPIGDLCPDVPGSDTADLDQDGLGDVCDPIDDVATGNPLGTAVTTLVERGVVSGCRTDPGRALVLFCPASRVTRGQMASFLTRAYGLPVPPSGTSFVDVPADHPHAPAIAALAASGITGGCSASGSKDPRFCPDADVTRAQMAVFLLRAAGVQQPPAATGLFGDVPLGDPMAPWIEELAARGVTQGCATDGRLFCPSATTTRAQMVVFLSRSI